MSRLVKCDVCGRSDNAPEQLAIKETWGQFNWPARRIVFDLCTNCTGKVSVFIAELRKETTQQTN